MTNYLSKEQLKHNSPAHKLFQWSSDVMGFFMGEKLYERLVLTTHTHVHTSSSAGGKAKREQTIAKW